MSAGDYELLKLAALAVNGGSWHPFTHANPWNPLKSHAQAKELRHLLKISSGYCWSNANGYCAYAIYGTGPDDICYARADASVSKKSVLRRAIVGAAAAIRKASHG